MNLKVNEIMDIMNTIEYGFKDTNGKNIINDLEMWNNEFNNFYYFQEPDELLKTKCGVCWDQVELERDLFEQNNIKFKTYFIYIVAGNSLPSHTFLTYFNEGKYYWFEHSWEKYKGIYEYRSEIDLLLDIKDKFKKYNNYSNGQKLFIYSYSKPSKHINCNNLYKYIETQELVYYE